MKLYNKDKFVEKIKCSPIKLGQNCPQNGQDLLIFDSIAEVDLYFGKNVKEKLQTIKDNCAEDYATGRELFAQNFDKSMYNQPNLVCWRQMASSNRRKQRRIYH